MGQLVLWFHFCCLGWRPADFCRPWQQVFSRTVHSEQSGDCRISDLGTLTLQHKKCTNIFHFIIFIQIYPSQKNLILSGLNARVSLGQRLAFHLHSYASARCAVRLCPQSAERGDMQIVPQFSNQDSNLPTKFIKPKKRDKSIAIFSRLLILDAELSQIQFSKGESWQFRQWRAGTSLEQQRTMEELLL